MGRIIQTTSPLGNVSSVTYDAMGRIKAVQNPLGQTTTRSYDARGLLSGISLPGGITASYTRNKLELITSISDPAGNNWQRAYDSQGRRTSTTDPLGNTISYQYNKRNRISVVNFPAGTLNLSYDGVGNITRKLYSDGTDLNYTFDAMDRLTGAEGITLGYNANGRITGSNGLTISQDAVGRIATIILSGKTITYTYDSRNLLTQVADWLGGTTTFTYDAAGRLIGITRPNGVATNYSYDSENHITGIAEGSIADIVLIRDGIGQITAATRNVPLEPTLTASTENLSYDAASQVSTYTYDAMGRLTNDNKRTYTWDLVSRMTGYTEDANTVTFTYDGPGYRLSRTEGGATRSYVWNYALGLPSVSVAREGGNDLRYFIHTPAGALLYSIDAVGNARQFYHFDEKGNTIAVTDDSGAVIGSYAYTPYGKLTASTGSLDNPFTWQGMYGVMDEGNGLFYMRARYYDSVTGRFISRDLIESISPKSVNPYQHASGNPLKFSDPLGLDDVDLDDGFNSMENLLINFLTGLAPNDAADRTKSEPKTKKELAIWASKKGLENVSGGTKNFITNKAGPIVKLGELGGKIAIIIYNRYLDLVNDRSRFKVDLFNHERALNAETEARNVLIYEKDINKLSSMNPLARSILRQMAFEKLLKIQAELSRLKESAKKFNDWNIVAPKINHLEKKEWFLLNAMVGELIPGEDGYDGVWSD